MVFIVVIFQQPVVLLQLKLFELGEFKLIIFE